MNNKMDGAKRISDPILSTSGQYVFSEDDLKITIHGTIYKIGRFYNSGKIFQIISEKTGIFLWIQDLFVDFVMI